MKKILTRAATTSLPVNYELRTSRHAFRIVKKIATGGFGITYQAENLIPFTVPGTNQVIPAGAFLALKECFKKEYMARNLRGEASPAHGCEEKVKILRKQFLNEAFTIMRLQQAYPAEMRANAELLGYVPIFHAGTAKTRQSLVNVHYFVMPFLIGGSLKSYLGVMDAKSVVWVAYRLLRALQMLHNDNKNEPPTLHYDIKPANIMLTETKAPVLIDFGISSGTENMGGTPDYTPYEQMSNSQTGCFSDLYSLGASLYELITNKKIPQYKYRPPYVGSDPYYPLTSMPDVVEKFRECAEEYEREFALKMNRPYNDNGQSFALNFLNAIDVALRIPCTGAFGRWQSATQWLDIVFKGLSPLRPAMSHLMNQKVQEYSQSVWVPHAPNLQEARQMSGSSVGLVYFLIFLLLVLLAMLAILFCVDTGIIIIN